MLIVVDGHVTISRGEPVLIDDSRALAAALTRFVQRCHCTVTYEDPRWRRDQVIAVWSGKRRSDGAPRLVPNGIPIHVTLPDTGTRLASTDVVTHVGQLLREFEDSQNPGSFTLVDDGNRVHVLPAGDALLARPVTWVATGPAIDLVNAFIASLEHATGHQIRLMSAPINLLKQSTTVRATARPAFEVLGRIVGSLARPVTWQLLYDINERTYYLNLYLVG